MKVGDLLIEAQGRITSGWKRWLREHCFLGARTAMVYVRLARHRDEIEAEPQRVDDLSLRAVSASSLSPPPRRRRTHRRGDA